MIILHSQPTLTDLEALISRVPTFPFSIKKLIELAREEHFPEEVINFLKTFPKDEVFADIEDLSARIEQVEIMQHEEDEQVSEERLMEIYDQ